MLETREVVPVEDEDRRLRDELEALQVELRMLRERRASLPERLADEEASLKTELDDAAARREAAAAELERLEAERHDLEARLSKWQAQLEARRREAEVLALGAQRRDHYVEWWAAEAARQRELDTPPRPWARWAVWLSYGVIALAILIPPLVRLWEMFHGP